MSDKKKIFRRIALIGCVLIAGLGIFIWLVRKQAPDQSMQRGRFGLGAPMAVNVAKAAKGDIPVHLMALGTITPLATATVKTQVAGVLQDIAFQEGQMVHRGDFLAQVDPRPYAAALAQAEGALARDEAQLANARLDEKRYTELLAQDSISEQQLATQKALVEQLIGTVATDKGQVATARLNLQYAHIVAPVSGRVGLRQVDLGNYVTPGDANGIVVITQLEPISAIFPIAEDNVPALMRRIRSGAKLEVEALDRANATLLAKGVLQTADNQLDTTTGTLKMRALFDNKEGDLFPNQFVNIRLLVDTLHDQVIVPAAAIQKGSVNGKASSFVYLVDPASSTVSVHAVEVGVSDGDRIAVTKGVEPGDTVVTEGGDRLRDGARVQLPNAPEPGANGQNGKWGQGQGKRPPGAGGRRFQGPPGQDGAGQWQRRQGKQGQGYPRDPNGPPGGGPPRGGPPGPF